MTSFTGCLAGLNAHALKIHLSVDFDDPRALPAEPVRQALSTGSVFTPDLLQAVNEAQSAMGREVAYPFQLKLRVGDLKVSRFGGYPVTDNWLKWNYLLKLSHPIFGRRGSVSDSEHHVIIVLPAEGLEAAKLKNALLLVTWRALFHERMLDFYGHRSLYIPPLKMTIRFGDEPAPSEAGQIAELRQSLPAHLTEGAETLFAYAAMRLTMDAAAQAEIDQFARASRPATMRKRRVGVDDYSELVDLVNDLVIGQAKLRTPRPALALVADADHHHDAGGAA